MSAPTARLLPLPDRGIEIALLDWGGDGPLALLHHANGFCAAQWAPVAEALRDDFRVVAMDARGHGHSSKPEDDSAYAWPNFGADVVAVAGALAAEHPDGKVTLGLGHSFGGSSLVMAAQAEPSLFEALVLADPVMPPPVTGAATDPNRQQRGGQLAEKTRKRRQVFESREAARESWSEKSMFAAWDPRAFDLYVEEGLMERPDGQVALRCPTTVEAAIFENGGDVDMWAYASRVPQPTLLLWAERGDFPRAVFEAVAERMPNAQLETAPTGHFIPMEAPVYLVEQVRAFTRER